MTFKRFVRWAVTDAHGTVVIGQRPNLPIMVGTLAAVVSVITPGYARIVFALVAFGALFTWAWLEIFNGSTPLRRGIGSVFMLALIGLSTMLLGVVK